MRVSSSVTPCEGVPTGIEGGAEPTSGNPSTTAVDAGTATAMDVDTDVDINNPSSTQTLTTMETGELARGEFGSAPLEVKDGVAVM